jgi:hypothetical protein
MDANQKFHPGKVFAVNLDEIKKSYPKYIKNKTGEAVMFLNDLLKIIDDNQYIIE